MKNTDLIPMRWPGAWKDPSALTALEGTKINYLLMEKSAGLDAVVRQANARGIQTGDGPPSGIAVMPGEWPGIKLASPGSSATASAGPTGVPWVDSNGWAVRLAAGLHPDSAVWIDAAPKGPRLFPQSYEMAVADTASRGGRLILALDPALAAGIAGKNQAALDTWARVNRAVTFFDAHKVWTDYVPEAVMGVVSDFSGDNEFFSRELLNLLDRTNVQYRLIVKGGAATPGLRGLRGIIYADAQPPSTELRRDILAFVDAGGMLITGPKWGAVPGSPSRVDSHPRYDLRVLGKGRVAIAREQPDEPYQVANDAVILLSHRYDLLRFWNGGAVGSYYTVAPDRKRAVVQLLFYAERGANLQRGGQGDAVTVQVAGRYRTARLWTLDQPAARTVETVPQRESLELHLPPISEYGAVDLEV